MSDEIIAGFHKPQPAQDKWAAKVREEYGFPVDASLEDVEQTAIALLHNPLKSIPAAELVLGHRVSEEDDHVLRILTATNLTPDEKFACLLLEKGVEEIQNTQGKM